MGACDVTLTYPGDLSQDEVAKRIQAQKAADRDCNGHQEGYSGDWQTIHNIDWAPHKEFDTVNDACEYALDNCDKREAMAVKAWDNRVIQKESGQHGKPGKAQRVKVWVICGWAAS
jgi:hypothetical protein